MASIVVSGDTSGAVTITAPAVAGTTTLTLPTTSGTILTTGGGAAGSFTTLTSSGASSFATSSGNVGIGTGSPDSKLIVAASTLGSVRLFYDNSSINYFDTDTHVFRNSAAAERMRIASDGNVGIGTNSPATKLQVQDGAITAGAGGFVLYGRNSSSFPSSGSGYFALTTNNVDATSGGMSIHCSSSGVLSERMRIDSSGKVLIGSSTAVSTNPRLQVVRSDATVGATNYQLAWFSNATGYGNGIGLYAQDNVVGISADFFGASGGAAALAFYTNSTTTPFSPTERMRIASGGELLLGASSLNSNAGGARFQLTQNNSNWISYITNTASSGDLYGQYIHYSQQSRNDTGSWFLYCGDTGGARFNVRSNGGLANYSANNVNLSDAREKTNIELAGSYLDKICAIPVKTFNYIDQNLEEDPGLTLGVVAQDVQAVAPELVMESNWASKDEPEKMRLSIYQTDLQYALMKCIQEQQQIINDLKARIETLEGAK